MKAISSLSLGASLMFFDQMATRNRSRFSISIDHPRTSVSFVTGVGDSRFRR
jgi:hypothetical protein